MTDTPSRVPLPLASGGGETFPTLTAAQIARIALHGTVRTVEPGHVRVRAGARVEQIFVVTAGRIEIVRESATGETLVTDLVPGQFSGEVSTLSGRRGFVTLRAVETSEVIAVERHDLLTLVQTDTDLSDIFPTSAGG